MIAPVTKSVFLVFLFLLANPGESFAQFQSDSIQVLKLNGSTIFVHKGKKLNPKRLRKIVYNNDEAKAVMKAAKSNLDIGNALGFAGGFMVGYSLASSAREGGLNMPLLAFGVVLIATSIGFSIQYKKTAKRAVRIYNQGLDSSTSKLQLRINGTGLAIMASF